MKRILGVFMLALAILLLGWMGYNLFIEMQPEAEGRSLVGPLVFSAGLIYVGLTWIRQGKPNAR